MNKKAAVIGSGIGGIATAIRLHTLGYNVSVFEANSYPGGKLSEIVNNGFRFDAGPSLFTMPQYVDELFSLAGKNPEDYFQYQKLEEVCKYFWDDGTKIIATADLEKFAQSVENELKVPKEKITSYLAESGRNYEILGGLFVDQSLHRWKTWFSSKALKGYRNILNLGLFSTLHQKNKRVFKHPKLVQLFNRYATYNGSDPYQTPATLSIIPHLEYNVGAFFPIKGMHSITTSLIKLAEDIGVKIHLNAKVEEIIIENKQATGIRIKNQKEKLNFNKVVSNMDITPTYRHLLSKEKAPEKTLSQPRSGSGLIFYWGVKGEFSQLGLHNILFSNDYEKEFDFQFNKKEIYHDPTVYINISSKIKKDDAPEGCENWFILINAPANNGQDWDKIIANTKKNVLKKIKTSLGLDIEPLIVTEDILDPRSIELKTSSGQGALYGTSSNNKFAAFFRHPNFSKDIKNLYFVGGSVHPGGGIPLALSSAKITTEMMND